MTTRDLERDWLSLNSWLTRCVLPASACLVLTLIFIRLITDKPSMLNHNALIVGFFALYFVLIRGGHTIMIRSLHNELMAKHKDAYQARLAELPRAKMRRYNIGYTLTRIKRDLIEKEKR